MRLAERTQLKVIAPSKVRERFELWIKVWILNPQPFGDCGDVQLFIGGNEIEFCRRWKCRLRHKPTRELNGVGGA